jgi:hypothetical protein
MRAPALALVLLAAACSDRGAAPFTARDALAREHPAPTEHWLDEDAESTQKERRKAWFEERHKAPPEVDWRAIERANGLLQIEKRNRLAGSTHATLSQWVERGSDNQSGRIHAAARSTDGQTLYAGSSLGGVWRGALDGTGWTPIGDNLYGGAHWLAVLPGDQPGDPDAVLAATDGGLVHVTRDQGQTWQTPTGLPAPLHGVRRCLVTSDGSHTVFLLVRSGSFHYLYRSTDRAHTFTSVRTLGGYAGDAWTPRTGSSALYLLRHGSLETSTDLGATWTTVGSLGGASSGGELAGSEAGAPRLWAILASGGGNRDLHRSDDGGASWSHVTQVIDYWGSLAASTVDPDLFAWGGVEVHRTANGGASFAIVNSWTEYYGSPATRLHADVPGMDVVPDGPGAETWYVSTDGGLYRSQDGLASVANLSLSGLRVSQYYSTHTSTADPLHVLAGAQDQGYQRAFLAPPAGGSVLTFAQLISGDYGHLSSGDGSHAWVFSTYPGFVLVQRNENAPQLLQLNFPSGEINAWLPPVVADPLDPRDFFWCGSRLWRYDKHATQLTWSASQHSGIDFSGGSGQYLSALAVSPQDPQRFYAATNDGRLFRSDDHGVAWTQSASLGPDAHYFYGTALVASASDVDVAWVGGSGYAGPAVFRTVDGGVTWQPYATGLPSTLVYCLGEAPGAVAGGSLFAGTETSVWRRDPGSAAWVDVTANQAPVTVYWSVEAVQGENAMRFGTYGRGIWDYRLEPPGSYALYGCGTNPAGSMSVLAGTPQVGTTLVLGVDNPLGTQAAGALPLVALASAPDPAHPCGTPVAGLGMAGAGALGELLVSVAPPNPLLWLGGAAWSGPGAPAPVAIAIPADPALAGRTFYAQGVLVDPAAAPGGVRFGLTEAIELALGP